jgi:hypothetical protein
MSEWNSYFDSINKTTNAFADKFSALTETKGLPSKIGFTPQGKLYLCTSIWPLQGIQRFYHGECRNTMIANLDYTFTAYCQFLEDMFEATFNQNLTRPQRNQLIALIRKNRMLIGDWIYGLGDVIKTYQDDKKVNVYLLELCQYLDRLYSKVRWLD